MLREARACFGPALAFGLGISTVTSAVAWHWYWEHVGVSLSVAASVAATLSSARQRWWESERGGQLFVDLEHPAGVLLARATPPHPADRAGRHWLELNLDRCRDEIARANGEGLRLVGYWHTHPQRVPRVSPQDLSSFSRFANQHSAHLPQPIAVIVGTSKASEGIRAWSLGVNGWLKGDFRS